MSGKEEGCWLVFGEMDLQVALFFNVYYPDMNMKVSFWSHKDEVVRERCDWTNMFQSI